MKTIQYIRVSTKRQARSGLGLEAQQEALRQHQQQTASKVLATYREVETGKTADRPELQRAFAHAKRSKATLVVAKLDRLARNAALLLQLQASGLELAFLDLPAANRFTIGIMALVAEHEARLISERTKAALQAYKRRGGLLGGSLPQCRNLSDRAKARGRKAASAVIAAQARDAYVDILPLMQEWRAAGLSQDAIAAKLNEQGHTTRRGKAWSQVQVRRVLGYVE